MDGLLEIGQFAASSGLTVAALRHYDEVDVLKPAVVDPRTAYRRYKPEQLRTARLICQLRGVDLPVEQVKAFLQATDEETIRAILLRHQDQLTERAQRLRHMTETAHTYLQDGVPAPPPVQARPVQVMLASANRERSLAFYRSVFGWQFTDEISSFVLGAYNTGSFFLVTIETWAGPASFGLLVDDVDTVHQRALDSGALEVAAPADFAWKPRSSIIDDPDTNRIQLSQG